MGQILPNWRVTLSVLFSAAVIVGAYLLTSDIESPRGAEASAESALLQAIAAKDSDGDGLPDWEESLYSTDPHTTDTFHLGLSDGEAVDKGLIVPKAIADISTVTSTTALSTDESGLPGPAAEGTLTAVFSQKFMELYLAAKQKNGGAALSAADTEEITSQAMEALSSVVLTAPNFKSARDLKVAGAGAEALKTFAASAEAVIVKNAASETTDEISYLTKVIVEEDMTALSHLAAIAKANRDTAAGLAALAVPIELAADHLFLVNSMMRLSGIINDFAHVDSDPLSAMFALQQYLQATKDLWQAFANIGSDYATAGIVFSVGTPGAAFVNLTAVVTAFQASQKP